MIGQDNGFRSRELKITGLRALAGGSAILLSLLAGCSERLAGAPRPSAVEPASGKRGSEVPVTVIGSDFYLGVVVSYSDKSRSLIDTSFEAWLGDTPLGDVLYLDSTRLSARVPSTLEPGTYSLTVRDPSGKTGKLADAFTVRSEGGAGSDAAIPDAGGERDGSTAPDSATPFADSAVADTGLRPPPEMDGSADANAADGSPGDARAADATAADATADEDAGAEVDAGTPLVDYCLQVPALPQDPIIDGTLEPGLALLDVIPVAWTGAIPIPAGNSARYAIAWRPDGLYAFIEISDPDRNPPLEGDEEFWGDGAELYVDNNGLYDAAPAYDDQGTRQFIITAPVDGEPKSTRAGVWTTTTPLGDWISDDFGAFPKPGGYSVEAFIRAADLGLTTWALAPGQSVGFDLSQNVSTDTYDGVCCGYRLGQYFARVQDPPVGNSNDHPYLNVGAFCNPVLLSD